MTALHACWTRPAALPGPDETVLSFLPPADEETFAREFKGRLLFARDASDEIRAEARTLYLRLSAELGATPDAAGRTLRADCGGAPSAWWWHPTSFKDPESDPAFGLLIAALTVEKARGGGELVLHGAPDALERVLRGRAPYPRRRGPLIVARALAARARTAWRLWQEIGAASSSPAAEPAPGGAALLGFWDWSPSPAPDGTLSDRYFKALPAELARRGLAPFWLCWLDRDGDPARAGRPWDEVLAPLRGRRDVVLLQSRLSLSDVLSAAGDFRPALAYLRRRRDPAFHALFRRAGLDLRPLFDERLLRGFLDGCLPRCELVRRAAERAAAALEPRLLVSFLEHYPFARALYAGARAGRPGLPVAAVQHASYCAEKTFLFLDPALEFRGEPDGLAAPTPDLALAMGAAARELFLACGYPPERVVVTGGPRYDALRAAAAPARDGGGTRVLCVAALDTAVETDMVEAAAAAASGLPGVEVAVRDHPFSRIAVGPRFAALTGKVRVTSGSLAEDLAWADVVLFTYSTVAEEAALQGKAVWQWRPRSYDASALADAVAVPRFSSVAGLRAALSGRRPPPLTAETRERIVERLFHRLDGGAAARAADALAEAAGRFVKSGAA